MTNNVHDLNHNNFVTKYISLILRNKFQLKMIFRRYEMKHYMLLMISLIMLVSCTSGDNTSSIEDKVKVHGAMKAYVDAKLAENNNEYMIEDLKGVFDYLHDGVKTKDNLYVSCADVKVGEDVYDIDYYVEKENGTFTVIKEVLHKIKKEKVNRTLWEKE